MSHRASHPSRGSSRADITLPISADDYITRFDDGIPPTSCVFDIIGCRVVCQTGEGMVRLMNSLASGHEAEVPALGLVKLELVRVKNKFTQTELDPVRAVAFTP